MFHPALTRSTLAVALLGAIAALSCTKKNPSFCDSDEDCTSASFPVCDVDGDLSGTANTCVAGSTVDAGASDVDAAGGPTHSLTVIVRGDGAGQVTSDTASILCEPDCADTLSEGVSVRLVASPQGNATFGGWSGDCSGLQLDCSLVMNGDKSVEASFDSERVTLGVALTGNGSGSVASNAGAISCPGTCSDSYVVGTSVTLTAVADEDSRFMGWSHPSCADDGPCTLSLDEATSVSSHFLRRPLLVTGNDGANRFYQPAGGTLNVIASTAEEENTWPIELGDYEGDGDADLLVANLVGPIRVYRNVGGVFSIVWTSAEEEEAHGVAWGDMDNDGDLDIAVAGFDIRVYRNDGDIWSLVWRSEGGVFMDVDWADYDGDGDGDLAAADQVAQNTTLYRNDAGAFVAATTLPGAADLSVEWGDIDGDDDPDLAVGTASSGPTRVYRNNGGVLSILWSSDETDDTQDLSLGDADGDGDLDLLVSARLGEAPTRLYRNDGSSFQLVYSTPELDETWGVAWFDFDLDGDLDFATGNRGGPTRVYRNDGGFSFTGVFSSAELDDTQGIAVEPMPE